MQIPRAKLSVVLRAKKGAKAYWAARGSVPIRHADGSLTSERREFSLNGATAKAREEEAAEIGANHEADARHVPLTFAKAYTNYVKWKGDPLYGEKLLLLLGPRQCRSIDDSVMIEVAGQMFKPDAKAAYVNRHFYTPVIAILKMGLKQSPPITRPAGHKERPTIKIPDKAWFGQVLPHMSADTRALVAFLTVHGRRLGDALGRSPADFNETDLTLFVGKAKNGEPLLVDLYPGVVDLMLKMPDWKGRKWLFSDGPASDSNVRRDILRACILASGHSAEVADVAIEKPTEHEDLIKGLSVPYFSPHKLGRHSFATRMLREGRSLQEVKQAGGWATMDALEVYLHLERKDYVPSVHRVGGTVLKSIDYDAGGKAGEGSLPAHATSPVDIGETPCP